MHNPLLTYDTVDQRIKQVRSLTVEQAIEALNDAPCLQPSIRRLLEKRLARDFDSAESRNAQLAKRISMALANSRKEDLNGR